MTNLSFLCMNRMIMKLNLNLKMNMPIIIKGVIIGAKVLKIVAWPKFKIVEITINVTGLNW